MTTLHATIRLRPAVKILLLLRSRTFYQRANFVIEPLQLFTRIDPGRITLKSPSDVIVPKRHTMSKEAELPTVAADEHARRASISHAEKGRWERLWPVIACGAGLFSDGYLNNVRCPNAPQPHTRQPPV